VKVAVLHRVREIDDGATGASNPSSSYADHVAVDVDRPGFGVPSSSPGGSCWSSAGGRSLRAVGEERLNDRIRSRHASRADTEDRHDQVLGESYCDAGAERASLIATPDSGAAGTSL
jgi:hypothetical protein